jgi:MFS family permease
VKSKSQAPPTPTAQSKAAPFQYSFTVWEALRTPAFWLISLGHAAAVFGVGAIFIHLIPHIVQRTGLSLEVAGIIVAFMLIMSLIGQLVGGYLGDKVDKRALLVGCMVGHAIALLILAYSTNVTHLVLFGILNGLAWGGRGPTQSSLRAEYFGTAHYATIVGFSSMLVMLGMVCGPIFAGKLADWQGSYTLPFTILAIVTALGSLFFVFARRPNPNVDSTN